MSGWSYLGPLSDSTSRAAGVTFSLGSLDFGAAHEKRTAVIAVTGGNFNPSSNGRKVYIGGVQANYKVQQASVVAFLTLAVADGGTQEITIYSGDTGGLPNGCKVWVWSGKTDSETTGLYAQGANGSTTNPATVSNMQFDVGGELFFIVHQASTSSTLSISAYNGVDTPTVDDNNSTFNSSHYLAGSIALTEGDDTRDISFNGSSSGTKSAVVLHLTASTDPRITASAGTYSQTGTAATPKSARKASAGTATYDQTVQPITLKGAFKAVATAGAYDHSGQVATLAKGNKVAAGAGSYDHMGASASLKRGAKLTAAVDTYSLTGSSAELVWFDAGSFGISAEAGAYTQTGTDATPKSGRKVVAGTAAYAMSGQSAGALVTRKIAAAAGSYDWSGATVTIRHSIGMATDTGPYSHVGSIASIVYGAYLIGEATHYRWNSPDDASLVATLIRTPPVNNELRKPGHWIAERRFNEGGRVPLRK